jgi:hypothetical protein
MRKWFIIAALAIVALCVVVISLRKRVEKQELEIKQSLLETDKELDQAFSELDLAKIRQFLDDSYLGVGLNGQIYRKEKMLMNLESAVAQSNKATVPQWSTEIDDYEVRIYGNMAITTGRALQTFRKDNMKRAYRFTNIYMKNGERWVSVGGQGTLITVQ